MHPTQEPATTAPAGPETTPADTLRAAASYLQRHGWTYGTRYELPAPAATYPAADIIGALRIAVAGHPVGDSYTSPEQAQHVGRAIGVLARFLDLHTVPAIEGIDDWNDSVPASTGEVITALRDAARWYEQRVSAYTANYCRKLLGTAAGR